MVLAGPGMEKDTQALARLMAEQAVTNMSCVPSQLEVLLMVRTWLLVDFFVISRVPFFPTLKDKLQLCLLSSNGQMLVSGRQEDLFCGRQLHTRPRCR